MLSSISWSELITILVLVLIPYYLYVLSFYFRNEFVSLYRNQRNNLNPGLQLTEALTKPEVNNIPSDTSVTSVASEVQFSIVHDLLEDLKKLFAVASKAHMVKEELIQAMKSKLKNYTSLKNSDVLEDITQ